MENIGIIIIVSVILGALIGSILAYFINNINKKIQKLIKEQEKISIDETQKIYNFFNELLEQKYTYYLTSDILAYFVNGKELGKKDILKLKETFYSDVSGTLNSEQKEMMLKVFSKKGIELYIHQSFLRMLNNSNIQYLDNSTIDKKSLNAIYNLDDVK